MKKIRYFIFMALCVIGFAACQDDFMNRTAGGVDVDKPVKVDLRFEVPKSMQVEVTRADTSYSTISTLRLYVFNGNSLVGEPQEFSKDGISGGAIETEGRAYRVHATLYQGTQTVYAVANASTDNYWQDPTTALDEAAAQGKETFLQTVYGLYAGFVSNQALPTLTSAVIPLSGEGEVTVSGTTENPQVQGEVRLKRPLAKIVFDIEESYKNAEGDSIKFTPQYYGVYKVASKAYVLENENTTGGNFADESFYNTPNDQPITRLQGGIFVPENIQTVEGDNGCQKYDDRDAFDSSKGTADGEKVWKYAPTNATYVVIKGTYTEIDPDGKLVRSADVSYTIHLGDFSGNNWNDFSVLRNYIYTYKMSVHGVDKIVVEAQAEEDSDDFQNGAEGDVIDVSEGSDVFNLDAHYEQVYVEYDLTDIVNKIREEYNKEDNTQRVEDLIANSFILSIHTPMNRSAGGSELLRPCLGDDEDGTTSMKDLDHKWIEFYSQSTSGISSYTTAVNSRTYPILNPWQVCRKMGEAVEQLYEAPNTEPHVLGLRISTTGNGNNKHYVARFTIFVDEYFYSKDLDGNPVDWADFTRTDPRTFMIATNIEVSPDGNSSYATARTYISQASILTFYNRDSADDTNALGIESYNEYGVLTGWGSPDQHSYVAEGDYLYNGRANMIRNTIDSRSTKGEWENSADIDFTHIGYDASNVGTHIWSYYADNPEARKNIAYKACLSRNRDLDGNGRIDDDEIRWYLPARSQYLRMGIGAASLGNYQLYGGRKEDMVNSRYPGSYVEDGALYYSNTPKEGLSNSDSWELYWAVEVGAYSSNNMSSSAQIRCVRNLPARNVVTAAADENDAKLYGDTALAGPVYGELKKLGNGNKVFDFENRLDITLFRVNPQTGPYIPHDEEDDANMLPEAFVVAKDFVSTKDSTLVPGHWEEGDWPWSKDEWIPEHYEYTTNYNYSITSAWSNGTDNPCAGYSEKEDKSDLGDWRVPNLSELMVMSTVSTEVGISGHVCLSSTQFSNKNVRIGFRYDGSLIAAWGVKDTGATGRVRCVRDATPEEIREVRGN